MAASDEPTACSCGAAHDGLAFSGQASTPWPHSSDDPTATKTLRNRYSAAMYRRFRALKGAVRTGVVERDAFGLRGTRPEDRAGPGDVPVEAQAARDLAAMQGPADDLLDPDRSGGAGAGINITPPNRGQFDFPSDPRKVREFSSWLDEQVERGVLEVAPGERNVSAREAWQNVYVRRAYEKGVNHADSFLVSEGVIAPEQTLDAVFRAPMHADAAGLLYTRAYDELDGVTDAMAQSMRRELTQGLVEGHNPNKIARTLNDRVENIGLHRGRLIARTEVIRAHNEGALNRYASMGDRLDGVTVLAEFSSAQDGDVCPVCAALEGTLMTVREARGRIPVHPNCRCTWLPVRRNEASSNALVEQAKRAYVQGHIGDDALDGAVEAALNGRRGVPLA